MKKSLIAMTLALAAIVAMAQGPPALDLAPAPTVTIADARPISLVGKDSHVVNNGGGSGSVIASHGGGSGWIKLDPVHQTAPLNERMLN